MPSSWPLASSDDVEYYEYSPDPRLLLAFFTRRGGVSRGDYESLNTSHAVGDEVHNVEENLERARRALGLPAILTLRQTHSDTVLPIADERTQPEALEGDQRLAVLLGNALPSEAYIAPIESGDRVVALLYADNLPDDRPIGDSSALEVVLHEAGLALEYSFSQNNCIYLRCSQKHYDSGGRHLPKHRHLSEKLPSCGRP